MSWLVLIAMISMGILAQDLAFSKEVDKNGLGEKMLEDTVSFQQKSTETNGILGDVKKKAENITRPVKQMFSIADEFTKTLTHSARLLLDRFRNPLLRGTPTLVLTKLTKNDALRLLSEITYLPDDMQNKLTSMNNLNIFTTEELKMIPTDIFQALESRIMMSLTTLTSDKLEVLCNKLMESCSHPRNLRKALQAGINCTTSLDRINVKVRQPRSQSAVMMEYIRKESAPHSWKSKKFSEVVRNIGCALSKDDIEEIPVTTIRKSLNGISRSDIPTKSVRHSLMKKMTRQYSSPAVWPLDFLANMAPLLEEMNVHQLTFIAYSATVQVLPELTQAGVQEEPTRIALLNNLARDIKVVPDLELITRVIPWTKADVKFMKNLNLTNLLEALSTVNVTFTHAEANMVAERLEKELMAYEEALDKNRTIDVIDAVARFADGFDMDYLESLPTEAFPEISKKMTRGTSRPKSKLILRKLRQSGPLSAKDIGVLFNGIDLEDVDKMPEDELIAALPVLKDLKLPPYLGRKIVKKVSSLVFQLEHTSECHNGFHRLGNLAKYVKPRFIEEAKVIPIAILNKECELNFDDIKLTKAQVYTLIDNVRGTLLKQSPNSTISVFSSIVMQRLGKLVKGLTADDLQALPLDTDLLSVIEVLSYYEDDLDFSQVEVIAEKIREYFDIAKRNVLSDADEITVLQIGRFLQYLNSDFELTKFPKELRSLISREIGKSSLLKIPTSKRRALLQFALKNTKRPGQTELQDVTRLLTIDEHVLMDLGYLRCGLTRDLVEKLSMEAVEVNIDDIQGCPWTEEVAEALADKALSYNIYLLKYREQMATMGALLLHLQQSDINRIRYAELAEITGYVAKSARDLQVTIRTTEANGFIRERTSLDHTNYERKRKRLFQAGFRAMSQVFDSGKCHELMRLEGAGNDVAELLDMSELQRCIDYIGSVDWNPDTARSLLVRIAELKKWGTLDKRVVKENSEYILDVLPKLVIGLSKDEISELDMSSPDAIASIGDLDGFTEEKLEHGFKRWLSNRGDLQLESSDIAYLQALTCGISADYIQRNIPEETIGDSLDILGKSVRQCNREKLNAYAVKLPGALGNRTESWKLRDIVAMGSLIGGLSERHLTSLTKSQIKVIEPEVITHMPPDKVKEFTAEQLGNLTYNQVGAITSMQRSYMSEKQMDALGAVAEVINGGFSALPFDYTMITITLAILRQILVCFEF